MTRETRGAIDDSTEWHFRSISFYSEDAEPVSPESDYFERDLGFNIYLGANTGHTKLVFWGVGIVSFGPRTEAQAAFIASLTPASKMSDFPGDYIALGFSESQWQALRFDSRKDDHAFLETGEYVVNPANEFFGTFTRSVGVVLTPDEIAITGTAADGQEIGLRIGGYERAEAQTLFLADLNQISGSSRGDEIIGSDAPEAISGFEGADRLIGGGGSDSLTGGAGNDHIDGEAGNDRMSGDDGHDQLFGGVGNDRLEGGLGDDVLAPGSGSDFVNGGDGNDRLLLDLSEALGSVTIEFASAGLIQTPGLGVVTYSNMETAEIRGGAFTDSLTGGAGDDKLFGNGSHDILGGGDGSDLLDGGEGNDFLDGGTGKDLMTGGAGNDTYVVDEIGDRVIETSDSGMDDLVLSSISYKLGLNVEDLTLTGSLNIRGTGNDLENIIVGNSGNNIINGAGGSDVLSGGDGADRFLFDSALIATTNLDDIEDFTPGVDTIVLDRTIFTKILGNGTLSPSAFVAGTGAGDASDRIVYDQISGNIFYDRDGTGAAAPVLFAHVDPGTLLTNADIFVVV